MINVKVDVKKCGNSLICRKCLEICPIGVFLTYPAVKRKPGKKAENWIVIPALASHCVGCKECVNICPQKAISLN
jgi:formate hydrogenlyase subunit 6/NADH:ubiquinone oxidoreductase subunit I